MKSRDFDGRIGQNLATRTCARMLVTYCRSANRKNTKAAAAAAASCVQHKRWYYGYKVPTCTELTAGQLCHKTELVSTVYAWRDWLSRDCSAFHRAHSVKVNHNGDRSRRCGRLLATDFARSVVCLCAGQWAHG